MRKASPMPSATPLTGYFPVLAKMLSETSFLPNPEVVSAVGGAVFPTIRKLSKRTQPVLSGGVEIGMYDDNYTPSHALLWAHGMNASNRKGWSFAHIWSTPNDLGAYTHLANLALIPECFGSLTDKSGPMTGYLRWHAWSIYGWKPTGAATPDKPEDFGSITWQYLPKCEEPLAFIRARIAALDNQRIRTLRPIMERLGML